MTENVFVRIFSKHKHEETFLVRTNGVQAAERGVRGVRGPVGALDADDGSLGVRRVVTEQGLMMGVGGLSERVTLRRRIGASVAGDRRLATW